nr:hypothetical protein [Candidatus Cloacimonadota bacterium]
MLIQQREALYTLICSIVFIILKAVLFPNIGDHDPEFTLGLLALFNILLWVIRYSLKFRFKTLDKMDKTIRFQAGMIAIHGVMAVMFIYTIVLYLLHRGTLIVPLQQVLNLMYFTWMSLYLFWTIFILVFYKKGVLNI